MKHNYHFLFMLLGVLILTSKQASAQTPSFLRGDEAQAYNAHTSDVKSFAKFAIGDQMGRLSLKYNLSTTEADSVLTFVKKMEIRKATYNYIFPENDTTRYKAKQSIDKEYEEALIKHLFKAGKTVGSYNCRMIMRNKDTLKLNTTQQESILAWAVQVNNLLQDDPKLELRPLEFPLFKKLFTETQLDLFLILKMTEEVNGQVQKSWKTLKENGLEYGLDSAVVSAELFQYHMARDRAIYVNYADAKLREAAIKSINDYAPTAIKRINNIPAATEAKKAYNGTLTW